MKKILVTGGTVFVSRFVANYFAEHGYDVYVLNRNTRSQVKNVTLIQADRSNLCDCLKAYHFDAVFDVTAYNDEDVDNLLKAINPAEDYLLISSSAVYPETLSQPFREEQELGSNIFWGKYGTDKIKAEQALLAKFPNAYILRPPYLYGPMQNLYREPFVFECAEENKEFLLPEQGKMKLQFLHVRDLCRIMEAILVIKPDTHIFNVGNSEMISVREWVTLCYRAVGKEPDFREMPKEVPIREYFCFRDYEYQLDVSKQMQFLDKIKSMQTGQNYVIGDDGMISLKEGIEESYEWFKTHRNEVERKGKK